MSSSTEKENRSPWVSTFKNLGHEHGFEKLQVEGKIPLHLNGTFYRNGPGVLQAFGHDYSHWFDGDGAVAAVRLKQGEAYGAVRMVETPGFLHEKQAGRLIYDGYNEKNSTVFQRLKTLVGGSTVKNTANTSVMIWQKQLFALMEAKLPVQLNVEDLSTLGEVRFEGLLSHALAAHFHRVPSRKAIYSFAVEYGPNCNLHLFELPDEGKARKLGKIKLGSATQGYGMIHDFIATENHLIFFCPPLKLDLLQFIFGKSGYADSLVWDPQLGTDVLIVPISNPENFVRFKTTPFFVFHYANAFEKGEDLIVDFVRFPDFSVNSWLAEIIRGPASKKMNNEFCRAIIQRKTKQIHFENLYSSGCEFPTLAPSDLCRDYKNVYVAAFSSEAAKFGLLDQVGKLDLKTGRFSAIPLPEGHYPGESHWVEGHVISMIYDSKSHRSYLGIANASQLEEGLIAKAWFNHHIPSGFHGIFTS